MNRIPTTLSSASLIVAGLLLLAAPLAPLRSGAAPATRSGPGVVVSAGDTTNPWD